MTARTATRAASTKPSKTTASKAKTPTASRKDSARRTKSHVSKAEAEPGTAEVNENDAMSSIDTVMGADATMQAPSAVANNDLIDDEALVTKRPNIFKRALSVVKFAFQRLRKGYDDSNVLSTSFKEPSRLADVLEERAARRDPLIPDSWILEKDAHRLVADGDRNVMKSWRHDLRYAALVLRRWSRNKAEYDDDLRMFGKATADRRREEIHKEFVKTWTWIGVEVL